MREMLRGRRAALVVALAAGVGLSPMACGSDQALVGGNCAAGYAPCGSNCCPVPFDATASDAASDALLQGDGDATTDVTTDVALDGATDGLPYDAIPRDGHYPDGPTADVASDVGPSDSSSDAPTGDASSDATEKPEAGMTCPPPLTDCGGVCVDTSSDPFNCKVCGNVCVSQLCVNSTCVGSTAGGVVFIGHDYQTTPAGTAQARVLSNAAFFAGASPHILSYERYANANAIARVKAILAGATITSTVTDSDIPNTLTITSYGVLVVQDQPTAASGAMATLGASWASTLGTFTSQGGVVIVLDGGTGVGEMPELSTATGLLEVESQAPIATGTRLFVTAPGDAGGVGVVSPYGAGSNSVSITLGSEAGSAVDVVGLPTDAGTFLPVVVHAAF